MKDTLLSLYYGNLYPFEQFNPRSKEYRDIREVCYRHYEEFIKTLEKLNPPLDERFKDIMDENMKASCSDYEETFIGGFRLGARIMLEVLGEDITTEE